MKFYKLFICSFLLFFASPALAEKFSYKAKILRVLDGDTIVVRSNQKEIRIRLCGIDAPESKQEHGGWSKMLLQKMLNHTNGVIDVHVMDTDRYGRQIASLRSSNVSFNVKMVEYGGAWVYEKYAGNCWNREQIRQVNSFMNNAKNRRLGLWENERPVQPWLWRRQNK